MFARKYKDTKDEGIIKMGHKKKNKEKSQKKTIDTNEPTKVYYEIPKSTTLILSSIATILIGVMGWLAIQVYNLNGEMKTIPDRVEKIETAINGDNTTENIGINARLSIIEEYLNRGPIQVASNKTASVSGFSVIPNNIPISAMASNANDVIGTDVDGNECFAGDYINEPILLTYTENNKEVFFLGQYNENYHWDGYCVTNAYNTDGTLYGICESNFNDGKRLDYKSFVYDEEDNTWIYSDRKCYDGYNTGINKTFAFVDTKMKNFTETNVRPTDIVTVETFLEKHDMELKSQYIGRTSDGQYNDTTGEAYYISYHDDGSVKTLYQGNFVGGEFTH